MGGWPRQYISERNKQASAPKLAKKWAEDYLHNVFLIISSQNNSLGHQENLNKEKGSEGFFPLFFLPDSLVQVAKGCPFRDARLIHTKAPWSSYSRSS